MTRLHFTRAAEIVRAILDGEWTNDPPAWADCCRWRDGVEDFDTSELADRHRADADYTRAVQTAEAFISFFQYQREPNGFNRDRFLQACGLVEPATKGRAK